MTPTSTGNPITLLSYNLWQGRAQLELRHLVDAHDPDVLCVQEAAGSSLPGRLGSLQLAVGTSGNRLGVGLYVKASRFAVEEASSFQLSTSRHDRLIGGTGHRLVAARVADVDAARDLVLGSFHGTPFTDSNGFRRVQVDDAHETLRRLGPNLPALMAGDYNHPILLGMLRRHIRRRGFTLAHTPGSTFHREGSVMRGKFDLATMTGLTTITAATLPQGASDHRPVLFSLDYTATT
ncbi:endonuclease/exonuclease/phosphatase family protein [Frondihabitans cladoniiphilus]|uniref:Endonuclease/exonuclease/phosphatase domain-containing protein n=1 Tax=Frondihabitans cladoniiphilus TaxID=715785 RepID=A0ABP8WGP5_9MICO